MWTRCASAWSATGTCSRTCSRCSRTCAGWRSRRPHRLIRRSTPVQPPMRQLVLQMSMSLDGHVLGPDGRHDWVFPGFDEEVGKWNLETPERAGVHAMGSNSYKEMAT